ncbi:MAG: electron transport complex subunit RsxC [Bacteroidales bacterium]|nr:electron transport complex subunit RsxC [Bacteroidales bacterium]
MAKAFRMGGIHPPENKLSAGKSIEAFPLPEQAVFLLNQHLGAPAELLVKKGDKVKTGALIAKANGRISANIHSSVSGTVLKIDDVTDAGGYHSPAVVIRTEGDEWEDVIDRSATLVKTFDYSAEEIIRKVADAGIVGLGGAAFPTHVKLAIPQGKKAEVLIVNGVECEPYLTADHALMLEKGEEILVGIRLLMKAIGVCRAVIGIEINKKDAIAHLGKLAQKYPEIEVCPLKVKYPQGSEKQLVDAILKRRIKSGMLPVDAGAVVQNVGTAFAVYEAVQKNKPLIEQVLTVTGETVTPTNFRVRIGVSTLSVIQAAGGLSENTGKILHGGPMMGKAIADPETPVTKRTNAVLIMPRRSSIRKEKQNCIRCATCVSVCPMGLAPYLLMTAVEMGIVDVVKKERIMDCIECGSCNFVCPANRPMLDYIRLGKKYYGK